MEEINGHTIIYHWHHKVPKHEWKRIHGDLVGYDTSENKVKLTIKEHAQAHKKLFEEYGRWQDEIAWKGLEGLIGHDEILKRISVENGKRLGKSRIGKTPWNKGKKLEEEKYKGGKKNKGKESGFKGKKMSEEQKQKLRTPKSTNTKQKLRDSMLEKCSFLVKTPDGVFPCRYDAQKHHNVSLYILEKRCKSDKEEWKDWQFIPKT